VSQVQRRRLPRGQGARLRQEIVEAAERVIAASGDGRGLTIRAVATSAGVTAPSIYRHFKDKSELLQAVVDSRFTHFGLALDSAVAGAADPYDHLRRRCQAYLRYAHEHPTWYRMLFSDSTMGWEPGIVPGLPGFTAFTAHLEAVKACLEAGTLEGPDPFRVALLLWAGLHGLSELPVTKPGIPWPPAEELTDELLAALGLHA